MGGGGTVERLGGGRPAFPAVRRGSDANGAYTRGDAGHWAGLDEFDWLLIERRLPEERVSAHAELARLVRTPICLDESITSAQTAADAIALGACAIVNVKPGRVGG